MVFLFSLLATFITFSPDSLPKSCNCPVPANYQPLEVNKDTLRYLKKQKEYKKGLFLTFHYLNKDSTDQELIRWLGDFSFHLAENITNNKKIRENKFNENPHVKFNNIQDTIGYIYHQSRKNFGPRLWNDQIKRSIGRYALCSSRCAVTLSPGNSDYFKRYIQILIALQQFEEARQAITNNTFKLPDENKSGEKAEFFLGLSRIYISYGAYEEGLKYAKSILQNYSVIKRIQKRWKDVFHYAIRNDDRIPYKNKPHLHEEVGRYIPEIEE